MTLPQLEDATLGIALAAVIAVVLVGWCLLAIRRRPEHEDDWQEEGGRFV